MHNKIKNEISLHCTIPIKCRPHSTPNNTTNKFKAISIETFHSNTKITLATSYC